MRITPACADYERVVISMTEKLKYYESIRREYPEIITKEQFYKIAHISKATALYLLRSGKVPCRDSGKKTRRYKIRREDVIFYLIDREIHPEAYGAPDLWYSTKSRSQSETAQTMYRKKLAQLSDEEREVFRRYVEKQLEDRDDLLTTGEAAEITGYCDTSINRWCLDNRIQYFDLSRRRMIPKACLIEFLVSPYCCSITRKPWQQLLLIRSFLEEVPFTEE